MTTTAQPIGVFDSGLGGLSVAREIRLLLPHEDIVYLADSAYCPYGGRPLPQIEARSIAVSRVLVDRGAKLIVAACNAASGAAIEALRETFELPIVGLEPAVKPAAATSISRRIAVLATPATFRSQRFHRLVDNHGAGVKVLKVACPGFVELVERGEVSSPRALETVRAVLAPIRDAGVDRVVLGCTHYPFLQHLVTEVLGDGVQTVDSGSAVARQVARVLASNGLAAPQRQGTFRLLTTGETAVVEPAATRLWGGDMDVETVRA